MRHCPHCWGRQILSIIATTFAAAVVAVATGCLFIVFARSVGLL